MHFERENSKCVDKNNAKIEEKNVWLVLLFLFRILQLRNYENESISSNVLSTILVIVRSFVGFWN